MTDTPRRFDAPEIEDPRPSPGREAPAASPGEAPAPAPERESAPILRVIREDGLVKAIEIDCTCGRPIRIACEYDAPNIASEEGRR